MLLNYIKYNNNIVHNIYLKIKKNLIILYPKLHKIQLNIILKKNINNLYIIFCIFYLFKIIMYRKGFFLYLYKKINKYNIIQYNLKKLNMFNFLFKYLNKYLLYSKKNQKLNISKISFNNKNDFYLYLNNIFSSNFISSYLKNKNFVQILKFFNIFIIFFFKKYNNIKYKSNLKLQRNLICYFLNFFKIKF